MLTLDQKIKILDLLDSGKSNVEVGRMYGKNESSIRTIKSQAAAIRSSVRVAPQTSKTVQMVRDSVLIKTERALNLWVEDMIRKHVPLDGNIMREKAKSLYEHYVQEVPVGERKEFKASKGWLYSFVQRFNLKNLKVTGESASADKEAADAFCPRLKEIIEEKEYRPEQVFNCDETGLFWKKMPNRTYIHKSAKQAAGFKAWKDRLTLVLCANAAGHMIKPGLIYPAKNPRALKNKNKNCLPVFWQHNQKAWMTATLFLEWMHLCFIPETKKYLEEKGIPFKVLLLIDNAPGHPEACTTCDDIHREADDEEDPAAWRLDKFSNVFLKAQALQDAIMEFDPSMDRALRVTRGITAALQPIQVLFSEAKKRRKQLPITMFLRRTPPPTRSSLDAPLPSTSSAYASPPRVSSPSSTDSAATEKRPASPPADMSPPRKLLRSKAYLRRPRPMEIVEVHVSSSDPDDPPAMGPEWEESDPLAHMAEGPI